jgi:hypothetical protein
MKKLQEILSLQPQTTPLQKKDYLLALIFALLTAFLSYSISVREVVGSYHDDALYLASAKSLAEGRGYKIISLPSEPAQTKYPFLYPAILSVLWKIKPSFPDNIWLFQGFSLFCLSLAVGLSYLYLASREEISAHARYLSTIICSTSYLFLFHGGVVLSDALFCLLFVASIWSFQDWVIGEKESGILQLISGLLFGALYLSRSVALAFLPVFLLFALAAKKKLRWFLLGFMPTALCWSFWMAGRKVTWEQDPVVAYYTDYLGWWQEGLSAFHNMLVYNLSEVLFFFYTYLFEGFEYVSRQLGVSYLVALTYLLGLALWSLLVERSLRAREFLSLSLACYVAAACIYPGPPTRILVCLLPILLAVQLDWAFRTFGKEWIVRLSSIALSVLIALNIFHLWNFRKLLEVSKYPFLQYPAKQQVVEWQSYQELFNWVSENTKETDILSSFLDPMAYLYTGRKSIQPYILLPSRWHYESGQPPYGSGEEILSVLKKTRANYLLMMPVAFARYSFYDVVDSLKRKNPLVFKEVYRGKDKRFVIYELAFSKSFINATKASTP